MVIKTIEELKEIINCTKGDGKSVLIKRGVFDIIHPGHVFTIQELQKKTDVLIMLTVSNELTEKKKGSNRPINSQKQRSEVLSALKGVDYVYCDKSKSREEYIELLNYLKPSLLAVTLGDKEKSRAYKNSSWELIEIKDKKRSDYSTTNIIEKILNKYRD